MLIARRGSDKYNLVRHWLDLVWARTQDLPHRKPGGILTDSAISSGSTEMLDSIRLYEIHFLFVYILAVSKVS